jgi:hypothetical protein
MTVRGANLGEDFTEALELYATLELRIGDSEAGMGLVPSPKGIEVGEA